jgi:hypothetical protein
MGHGIVLKGIVKYYSRGKNIPHTFGHTDYMKFHSGIAWNGRDQLAKIEAKAVRDIRAGAAVGSLKNQSINKPTISGIEISFSNLSSKITSPSPSSINLRPRLSLASSPHQQSKYHGRF